MADSPRELDLTTLSGERWSRSAEESRRAQLERIRAMTPLERMALALDLGRRRRLLASKRTSEPTP